MASPSVSPHPEASKGLLALILAYVLWAFGIILFKQFSTHVPTADVVAHRAIWSVLFLLPIVLLAGKWRSCLKALTTPKVLGGLALTSLLISINWSVFIWSIETDRVLQSSMGYYINPLCSVLLGVVVLSERLRPAQIVSVLLASASVAAMLLLLGIVPWIPVCLAFSFAFYGLLRKVLAVDHLEGLFIEIVLLLPFALAWLGWRALDPTIFGMPDVSGIGISAWLLLMFTGPATAIPLLLFAYGVRRRSLTTVGFTQYINPTLQFLMAVLLYGELFGGWLLLIFSGVWTALAIFLVDLLRHERKRHHAAQSVPK